MSKSDRFRDPVHGFITVSPLECRIINSRPFQRLRNIKQLAFTYYVYHGAEHTRFGHSLGVMHIASKAFNSAISKNKNKYKYKFDSPTGWLEQILRLIALTHDLGHAPFSHAGEDLFPINPNSKKNRPYSHEDMTQKIITETEIADIIKEIGKESQTKYGPDYDITPELVYGVYAGSYTAGNPELILLKTFMDSELDCDKMDYLLRDSLFCGVSYGQYDIERLISCLTLFEVDDGGGPRLGIEKGGVQAFEAFILARYFMFIQVYFHRIRRFFDKALYKALKDNLPNGVFPIDVEAYLEWDDIKVMELLRGKYNTSEWAKYLIERTCWKKVYTTKPHPLDGGRDLFDVIENRLEEEFKNNFATKFIIDTSADKDPHKINLKRRGVTDEDAIAIVDEDSGEQKTIAQESYIISNIKDEIDIRRIFATPELAEEARTIVNNLTEKRRKR